ncbi:unnamed protein product [Sphagnum jensenii]|uniref:Uncharacterized protein n=1 Tax=Sphagnum jensenii TaxID=128206 RepID=A0ABP1AS09_9BRYO
MIATDQKSAKVKWHSSIDFSSTTKPVPTPLPLPRMQEKACILNRSEQEQSKHCQAVNVTDGFQKHDGALELKGNVGFNVQVNGKDAVSREEQAAIKIQQAFQGHLALKGLVRLQALVHGCIVRRQAATTLRALKALVQVQACVRGHWVQVSQHGQAVQQHIKQHHQLLAQPKAARKHEQAMANVFSQQSGQSMLTNMGDVGLKDGRKPSTKKREAKPCLVSQPVHNGKAEPIPLPLPPPPKLPIHPFSSIVNENIVTSLPATDHLSSWHVPIPSDLQGSLSPEAYALKDVTINGVTSVSSVDCNSAGDDEREGFRKASPEQSPAANKELLNDIANNMKEVEGGENDLPVHISLEGGVFIEKTADITGIESPIHRKSLGGDQTKGAVKWR